MPGRKGERTVRDAAAVYRRSVRAAGRTDRAGRRDATVRRFGGGSGRRFDGRETGRSGKEIAVWRKVKKGLLCEQSFFCGFNRKNQYFDEYKILSYYRNVYSLFAFLAFVDFEFDVLSFLQAAETFFVNTGVVNKDVATCFGCDKAITFGRIKPLYCTFHKKCN